MTAYDNGVTGPSEPVKVPPPAPVVIPQSTATTIASKIPFWGRAKDLAYSYVLGQWAVGFWSALYVLVTQAHYFGKSFAYIWNHLNVIWHFKAIPWACPWIYNYYGIFRHIFMRDAPEAILAFAVVAMIIPKIAGLNLATRKKSTPPWVDRVIVKLGMPSPYQGQLGRHPDTSGLQYLFLVPSILLAALPGEIAAGLVIFGGIALTHMAGYTGHGALINPASWWIPIVIGIAGGKFAGHKPALKAGADIQRYYMGKRIVLAYAANKILRQFGEGLIPQESARDQLTRMPRTSPSLWYPEVYRRLYRQLLAKGDPVRHYSWVSSAGLVAFVVLFVVAGGWGVYLRKYGIHYGFWMPW